MLTDKNISTASDSVISLFSTRVCHVKRNYIQSHPDEEVAEQTMMLTLIHTARMGVDTSSSRLTLLVKSPTSSAPELKLKYERTLPLCSRQVPQQSDHLNRLEHGF